MQNFLKGIAHVRIHACQLVRNSTSKHDSGQKHPFLELLHATRHRIIAKNYPELDGSDDVCPAGKTPEYAVFSNPNGSYVSLYTSHMRIEEVFKKWSVSRHDWVAISAPGYQLLRFLGGAHTLWINSGLDGCQYCLDPDMVEILLSRPEPPPAPEPGKFLPSIARQELAEKLEPLRTYLASQPTVRAAWLFRKGSPEDSYETYEIGLLMQDPEDTSLLEMVSTIAKAVSPLDTEWYPSNLMGDDDNLRNLVKERLPFYTAADFLKKK